MNTKVFSDDILRLENDLNERLKIELLNENIKFKPIDIIFEGDDMDPVDSDDLERLKRKKE